MRKSIFLTMTVMLFVGIANLYGQSATAKDDSNATPTKPTDCTENANFPAIGVPHTYEVVISGGNYSGEGLYNWYVTQQPTDLLDETEEAGKCISPTNDYFDVKNATDFSVYHEKDIANKATTKKKIGLTWKSGSLLNTTNKQYFLVLKYKENNGTCDAMNMKVMKIEPLNRFQLEMVAFDKDAATTDFTAGRDVCADEVRGAKYNTGTNQVEYNYGTQTLYYKVTAKGFTGKWLPKFRLPELLGTQTYESVKIYTDLTATTAGPALNTLSKTKAEQELIGATTLDVAVAGTEYLLEVVIKNNTYETLTDQELKDNASKKAVAVDGTFGGDDNTALKDQADNCTEEAEFADHGKYTIKARPTIKATSGGFIQKVQ